MKFITNIIKKQELMSEEEFKSYLINEVHKLEENYQKVISCSFRKYDRFSRYIDKNKLSSTRKKLVLLQKEADKILGYDGSKYEVYSYMLNKYDYKYDMNIYKTVCELKWCDDINKKYELLKQIKKEYRNLYLYLNENKLIGKKALKEMNGFIFLINEKYRITKSIIKNNKKQIRESKVVQKEKKEEKEFYYNDLNLYDLNDLLIMYRDNIREGKITNDLVKNMLVIIKRVINEKTTEEDLNLLYSIMDSIKYRKNSLDNSDEEERLILNSSLSILKKYIEIQDVMNKGFEEPHDYKFDIILELLKDKENYSVIKKTVSEFPQIVNVRNDKKSILTYILAIYLNNYKMILDEHKYDYNIDYVKEVYRLFSNSASLYLSFEDKKDIDRLINDFIEYVTEKDISSRKQNYAINEVISLQPENVIKEKKYLKKVDKMMFDANMRDISFLDFNHSKRPSEIDLSDEHTFMLNDPYTCYSYVEEKGIKSLKIHTSDISNLVEEGSALDNYIYNCTVSKKNVKNDILSYLKFKEGDIVSALTYEIVFDNDRDIKEFKTYRSRIKVDGDILDYSSNEYVYQNLRRIVNDYIKEYGDVPKTGLSKIEHIINSLLQKQFAKTVKNNNLPLIAKKNEYKNGLSPDTFSYIKNMFCKLEKCDYKRLGRIFSSGIDETYYDDRVRSDEEYDLHLTGTPNYIYLLNQRMIKELINNELGYGNEFYIRQKDKTRTKYSELKDTLNDILNYKSEIDFDYKQRRNYKTYVKELK